MTAPLSGLLHRTERRIRIISILRWAVPAGLSPVKLDIVHSLAYLADALSPVWNLPILDGQLLKTTRPYFPALQHDLDELVGTGLVEVTRFKYSPLSASASSWGIDADYVLREDRTQPIFDEITRHPEQVRGMEFVREVVFAASGLGVEGLIGIGGLDAAYSDPQVDLGGLLDVNPELGRSNKTAQAASRIATLISDSDHRFSDAELVHLYVRHLYSRMQIA